MKHSEMIQPSPTESHRVPDSVNEPSPTESHGGPLRGRGSGPGSGTRRLGGLRCKVPTMGTNEDF